MDEQRLKDRTSLLNFKFCEKCGSITAVYNRRCIWCDHDKFSKTPKEKVIEFPIK